MCKILLTELAGELERLAISIVFNVRRAPAVAVQML